MTLHFKSTTLFVLVFCSAVGQKIHWLRFSSHTVITIKPFGPLPEASRVEATEAAWCEWNADLWAVAVDKKHHVDAVICLLRNTWCQQGFPQRGRTDYREMNGLRTEPRRQWISRYESHDCYTYSSCGHEQETFI